MNNYSKPRRVWAGRIVGNSFGSSQKNNCSWLGIFREFGVAFVLRAYQKGFLDKRYISHGDEMEGCVAVFGVDGKLM